MDELNSRAINMAEIMVRDKLTVRQVAKIVGVSKSTVHKDLKERLKSVNYLLYEEVVELLDYNKKIRHIRGGESTKLKYENFRHQA
ncbi:MAG: sporulation transcriptional regulator SpoIIID [bacterium]